MGGHLGRQQKKRGMIATPPPHCGYPGHTSTKEIKSKITHCKFFLLTFPFDVVTKMSLRVLNRSLTK